MIEVSEAQNLINNYPIKLTRDKSTSAKSIRQGIAPANLRRR
ncbi:MAG: hypothetical protein U5K79_08745 [Cyclobacteriaceae bacterium]|nr:hypothetical protein [Cyclobacteriaceae bacterium]